MGNQLTIGTRRSGSRPNPAAIEALTSAISSEIRLLEDLIGIMRRQREAVANDDLEAVDDSVFATHRVLVTLGEARRKRRSLASLIGAEDDTPLKKLNDVLGDAMSEPLRFASEGLHAAALVLSREVELNRHVLREALANGSEYVNSLRGDADAKAVYGSGAKAAGDGQRNASGNSGGLLLNRTA